MPLKVTNPTSETSSSCQYLTKHQHVIAIVAQMHTTWKNFSQSLTFNFPMFTPFKLTVSLFLNTYYIVSSQVTILQSLFLDWGPDSLVIAQTSNIWFDISTIYSEFLYTYIEWRNTMNYASMKMKMLRGLVWAHS